MTERRPDSRSIADVIVLCGAGPVLIAVGALGALEVINGSPA
ncbi:MAG: hypothetical protein ACRDQ7_02770 [Haloechinothrix sp.]